MTTKRRRLRRRRCCGLFGSGFRVCCLVCRRLLGCGFLVELRASGNEELARNNRALVHAIVIASHHRVHLERRHVALPEDMQLLIHHEGRSDHVVEKEHFRQIGFHRGRRHVGTALQPVDPI
jgi:hypothetical protein